MEKWEELYEQTRKGIQQEPQEGLFKTPGAQQAQEETAYTRMMRERYGTPQAQGQPQAQKDQPGYFRSALRGAAAQGLGVIGNQAEAVASFTGNETAGKIADSITDYTKQFGRPKEYGANDIFGSVGQFADYAADPQGLAYDVGGGFGSTAALAAEAAVLAKALAAAGVTGAATLGAGAIGTIARKLGLTSVERALATEGGRRLIGNLMLQIPLEAGSEAGGTGGTMTHDEQTGQRLQNVDRDAVRSAMAKDFAGNVAVLGASNLMEGVGFGRLFGGAAKGLKGKAKQAAEFLLTNAGQNAWEEGAQTGADKYARGEINNFFDVVNPFGWDQEQRDAAAIGGIAGVGQGGAVAGMGKAYNKMFGSHTAGGAGEPPTPVVSPAEQGKVLANSGEFPEATEIAMTDKSGNPVERMRNLQGAIPYEAADGTNCMRTVGLALGNTPYGDMINVDEAIDMAGNLGQLQDPDNYIPRPGDLAVVNDGNHIVMVTESGGTIQNGQSANGVYESDLSPAEMFGGVKYYISTSEFFGDNLTPAQRTMPAGGTAESQIAEQPLFETAPKQEQANEINVQREQNQEEPLTDEQLAARMGGDIPQGTPINRSSTSYPHYAQKQGNAQQAPYIRRYEPQYLNQLRNSNMSNAELVETARKMQGLPDVDPAKQIIIDKLRRRGISAGTGFTMEGNYPATRNQSSEVTAPGKLEPPRVQQQKLQNPPAAQQTFGDDVAQQFVDHYIGNPQSFMAHAQAQAQRIKQMYQSGTISQEQAVNNLQMLGDLVDRVMPAIQNDGVIRQRQSIRGIPFSSSEGHGTTQQTAQHPQQRQAANIKPKDMPRLLNVARNALAGDPGAVKRFMNYKPEVQQTLRDIVTGILPVNEALRSRQEVPELPAGRSNENGQAKLQKPETGEGEYQNKNAESGQDKQGKDTHGETTEKQGEDVKEKTPEEIETEAAAEVDKLAEEFEKPPVANPVSADEVPDTLLEESAAKEKLEDFGEKIGGARKDTATKRGSTGGKTGGDTDKAKDFMKHVWFRNYTIEKNDEGKWVAKDKNSRWWYLDQGHDTEQEAKTALFKYVMNKKHRFNQPDSNSEEYAIERVIGSGSDIHWFALKKGFESRDEAKQYFNDHLEEIFKINTTFGESDIPTPLIKSWQEARTGNAPERLKKGENATAKMFSDTFGFRGVQFGNWNTQKERQSVLNASYEALLDLADALEVSPKDISLGGELGIAFGARGRGGQNAALAHYEPLYTVINLTKMKGAGSLVHEWMHSVDHYLMLHTGALANNRYVSNDYKRNEDGSLANRRALNGNHYMSSENPSELRDQVRLIQDYDKQRNAIVLSRKMSELVSALEEKDDTYTEDPQVIKAQIQQNINNISNQINSIKIEIKQAVRNGRTNHTTEDLVRLRNIFKTLLTAEETLNYDSELNYEVTPALKALNVLFKKLTNKGLLTARVAQYPFWQIRNSIKRIQALKSLYNDAVSKKIKRTQKVTDFKNNSSEIDKGRTTPYWATTREMLARAFTTMVEDSLAEKGYASNFLAFGDNDVTGFGKPFPEGEERKTINEAFKRFFKAFKADIDGVMPKAEEVNRPVFVPEQTENVSEETVQAEVEKMNNEVQEMIRQALIKHGLAKEEPVQTPAADTAEEPETNSEETVTSENEAGNEPENVVESEQEAESEEGEEDYVDNEEGLSGVPEGETSEGLSGNEEGRDAGSVRAGATGNGEGVLQGSGEPVQETTSEQNDELSGSTETSESSGTVRTGNDERNDVRAGVEEPGETAEQEEEPTLTPAQEKDAKASEIPGHNFIITTDYEGEIGEGGKKTKYKNNVAAIRLLKQLETENRMATPTEQEILAKYVGWGGIKEVFDSWNDDWKSEYKELKELLTEDEWNSAMESTTNAHYTSIPVIRNIWKAIERLGFKGGRVLEPSMGVGNFFGAMPESLRSKSTLNGVELDHITGGIAKQLYQKANITIKGYQDTRYADNYFDLAISNVPFSGKETIRDKRYKPKYKIHNYFFARSLDKVRPGGLICFITSTGTMDSGSDSRQLRHMLADKADFIGAIRLPNTSFKGNAGTSVTTDLIFLQKRSEGAAPASFNHEWLDSVDSEVTSTNYENYGKPLKINKYYQDNPEMLIGKLVENTMYGRGGTVASDGTGLDVSKELEKRLENLPKDIYKPLANSNPLHTSPRNPGKNTYDADPSTREGAFRIHTDGKVYKNDNGQMVELDASKQKKAKDYVGLRGVVQDILDKQVRPETTEEELKKLRKELNKRYDKYVKDYGYLNSEKGQRDVVDDPEYGKIAAIEYYDKDEETKKVTVKKRDIFTKRTVKAYQEPTHADTPTDALALSLSNKNGVDIDYMAQLLGRTQKETVEGLGDLVYQDPVTMNYVTAEEYLSGNVREKLEAAEMAAKENPAYKKNAEALKRVQPVDLRQHEITSNLGAPWIPDSDITQFANEIMGSSSWRPLYKIKYIPESGSWIVGKGEDISESDYKYYAKNYASTVDWGTKEKPFKDILEALLNLSPIRVTETIELADGTKKTVLLEKETLAAQAKAEKIKNEFQTWLWGDKDRKERLLNYYNRNFNNWRLREYDGSHLTFPWKSEDSSPFNPWQKNAIWRILQPGNVYIAHCVGAGKTWTMQAAGMELRRLGIARKPMYVVPNHMLKQFEDEFREICPQAKLLVLGSRNIPDVNVQKTRTEKGKKIKLSDKEIAEKRAVKVAGRQKVLSSIAMEDWDGIIVSHFAFKRFPLSDETVKEYYDRELAELDEAIRAANEEGGKKKSNRTVSRLAEARKRLENELKDLVNAEEKDIVIPFEQLGIDQLFVDEADLFKNLRFTTKMNRVSGISNSKSQRATDMFMKTQYITKANNGRGVCFASGTPISNSIAEVYTTMRYMDYDGLEKAGLSRFDSWAQMFTTHETKTEINPDTNGYRQVEKLNFVNVPEMIRMFRKFADVKRPEDLTLKLPKLKNGTPTIVTIPKPSALADYQKNVVKGRADAIRNRRVDPSEDNMLKLTSDLRKAALDMRLVDPSIPASKAGGKLRAVVDYITKKYKQTTKVKGTQLVFLDLSTPKGVSDKVTESDDEAKTNTDEFKEEDASNIIIYEEIKKALIAKGIPKEQIAFAHDAKNDKQKRALFTKVRNGSIRVLIGSTEKMGAGTNCQDHVVALLQIDCPWRPRDVTQRNGRALRQGNKNEEIDIVYFVTEGSYDANMWEKVKDKQDKISRAMSGDLTMRTIPDVDEDVATYAEIEALSTGNPLMKEKTNVDQDVRKYESLRYSYNQQQADLRYKYEETNPAKIKAAESDISHAEYDMKGIPDLTGDKFKIKINGKTYTKYAEAKEVINKIAQNPDYFKDDSFDTRSFGKLVGEIGDLRIYFKGTFTYSNEENGEVFVTDCILRGFGSYECNATLDGIVSAAKNQPKKLLESSKKILKDLQQEQEKIKEQLTTPFEHQEKLDQLLKRQEEINKALHIGEENQMPDQQAESENKSQYSVREAMQNDPVIKRSIKRLIDEAEEAFKGAKDVKVDTKDGSITFTMPNGVPIKVSFERQITDAQLNKVTALREHGLADKGGKVIIGGLHKKMNAGSIIALSAEGSEGTGYHEAFHAAMAWVLNDNEKAAMDKYYGERAKKTGADAEELMAEGFRLWKLAHAKGSGTIFGKLYHKILDFADAVRAFVTRTSKERAAVTAIFGDIASGDVWNRDARGRFTGGYNENYIKFQAAMSKRNAPKTIEEFDKAIREADKPSKIGFWFTTSKGAEITIPGSNYKHIQDGDHPLTIKQWKAVIENLENADYAEKDNVVGPNGGVPVQIKIDTPLGKAGVSLEVLPNGRILVDTAVFNNDAAIDNWIKNKKSSQTLGIEPNGKQDRILGRLSLFDIIRDKLGIVNKFKYSVQEYSSADTSLNQIPSIFKRVQWQQGTTNIDIGGGRFNTATDYMKEHGVNNIVFDPFNRDTEHNRNAFDKIKAKGDTVTVANVLNVIKEQEIRDNVILQAAKALKPDGTAYFGIYEGSGTGEGKATSKGWQNNRKTADYVAEIAKHFNDVSRKGNMIIAKEPVIRQGEKATWSMDASGKNNIRYSIRSTEGNDKTATGKVAQAMRNTERLTTVESGKEWIKEKWKNFYVDWIDKNHRMHDFDAAVSQGIGRELTADERVYDRVQTLSASASGMATGLIEGDARNIKAINEHLKHKKLKYNVTLNMIMKKIGKEVMDKAAPDYLEKHGLSNWVNAFGNYLGARRLLEMEQVSMEAHREQLAQWAIDKAAGKKVGKKPVWSGYTFPQGLDHDTLQAMVKEAPRQFADASDMYYKFNDNVLTILEDAGLISEATHDLLSTKYKNYCPLMRDFTDTAAADNFIGGLTNGGRGIANVSNMLKHISMEGSGRAIINPLESTVKAVSVACNRAERNKVGQMAVNTAMKNNLTRLIKAVPGSAPDAKNCIFTVMYNGRKFAFQTTQELYNPIVGYNLPAAGFVMGSLRAAARALRTGATTSPSFIVRNLIRDTIFAAISSKHGFKPFVDTIRGMNAILNNPELKAEFETAGVTSFNFYGSAEEITKSLDEMNGGKLQIHKPTDILKALLRGFSFASELVESGTRMGEFMRAREQGESIEASARAARELTLDFSRSGVTGEKVNQMVPFFNACLQGGDKLIRLFREDPAGTSVKVAEYIILPSMLLWAINHDEPWYKELDPNIKNTCWILPGGSIRIPKPQEAGVFFGSGMEMLLDKMYDTDPDAGKNWAINFIEQMTPNVIPTLFLPLLEWMANYSFFRGKAIAGKGLEKLPDEMQYYQGTSEASKAIGSVFKVSPVKVDNLIRGYTGTMGMFIWQGLMDWTSDEKNNRPAKKLSEMPFIRDFNVTEMNLRRTTDEFYELAQNAQKWQSAYGKKGSPPPAVSAINKANTIISKKQKEIREISANPRLSPERKRELITVRRILIKRVAERTLERYRDKY